MFTISPNNSFGQPHKNYSSIKSIIFQTFEANITHKEEWKEAWWKQFSKQWNEIKIDTWSDLELPKKLKSIWYRYLQIRHPLVVLWKRSRIRKKVASQMIVVPF